MENGESSLALWLIYKKYYLIFGRNKFKIIKMIKIKYIYTIC